jgi:hypothetical protein
MICSYQRLLLSSANVVCNNFQWNQYTPPGEPFFRHPPIWPELTVLDVHLHVKLNTRWLYGRSDTLIPCPQGHFAFPNVSSNLQPHSVLFCRVRLKYGFHRMIHSSPDLMLLGGDDGRL